MSRYLKLFLQFIFILILFGCKNDISHPNSINNNVEDIEYPTFSILEYSKMDKYEVNKIVNNIKYKYTYFFNENMCVNSKEELIFTSNLKAQEFYKENKDNEEYMEINIQNNLVSYYYNPEYFEYMMYPKEVLIELLNSSEFSE